MLSIKWAIRRLTNVVRLQCKCILVAVCKEFITTLICYCFFCTFTVCNCLCVVGWIYAVYSPVDSVSFSGNFLHSFAVSDQLSVFKLEQRLKVCAILLSFLPCHLTIRSFKVFEFFLIFKALKVLVNRSGPWKSFNFIFEVLTIWVSRNVLTKYIVHSYLTAIHYSSFNDTNDLPFVCKRSIILECEHCYLLAAWLSGFVFTVFHVLLTADAV